MGRIKGWKKRYENQWESVSGNIIVISSAGAYFGTWEISLYRKGIKIKIFPKEFTYKEDATKFVIEYMKKHPKG